MQIQFEARYDVSVVIISGSVDSQTAEALLSELIAYVDAGHLQLVADLGAVDYTSSAGLRALLSTVKATRRGGGDLRLTRPTPNVLKVLELSGFTSIMKLYDEVDVAVASFGPATA
jgi:anti-anti-sigma factor